MILMKSILNKFSLAAIILFVSSCSSAIDDSEIISKDILLSDQESVDYYPELILSSNYKISPTEALEEANDFLSFWNKRTLIERSIKELKPILVENKELLQRYLEKNIIVPDTIAYICNFENEKGFLLLSADKRLQQPIFTLVESGNLNDSIANPGMDLFFSNLEGYIVNKIRDFEEKKPELIVSQLKEIVSNLPPKDQIIMEGLHDFEYADGFSEYYYSKKEVTFKDWHAISQVKPLSPVEWGQGYVYNIYTVEKGCNGNAPYTGCVATATAQLMTYWKYPQSFDNHNYDWNQMKNYTDWYSFQERNGLYKYWMGDVNDIMPFTVKDDIARLMERIGYYVDMDYRCNESGAKVGKVATFLNNLGYIGGNEQSYDYDTTVQSLNQGSIVLSGGWATKKIHRFLGFKTYITYHGGHAWLIDGYLKLKQETIVVTKTYSRFTNQLISSYSQTHTLKRDYIHNNWGWGGQYNGYFFSNSFNSNNVNLPSNSFMTLPANSGEPGNYQYQTIIYPFIKKPQ